MANIKKIRETRAQLETLQAAIAQVETNGQSVGTDGVQYQRADLKTLYARENQLERKLGRLQSTRPMVSATRFTGGGYA